MPKIRSIKFEDKVLRIVEKCAQKRKCSFNKAVNEIVLNYAEAMNKEKVLQQKLTSAQEIQEKINAIYAVVVEHDK